MKIQPIRNATMKLFYGPHCILTDPYLSPKYSLPTYAGKSPNPCVELPMPVADVLADVQMTLLSHIHSDHFDKAARELLPKAGPIYCQPGDEERIRQSGFSSVQSVEAEITWEGIKIVRTGGQHGSGDVLDDMGQVSGYVFIKPGEPVVYWVGDSILCDEVIQAVDRFKPDVILTHSCGAVWGKEKTLILMDAAQTIALCQHAPASTVVAIHMEAVDHATITRRDLAEAQEKAHISPERLLIPQDGELLEFTKPA